MQGIKVFRWFWSGSFDGVYGNYTPRYTDYDGSAVYHDPDLFLVNNAETGEVVDFMSVLNPYHITGAESYSPSLGNQQSSPYELHQLLN